MFTIIPAKPFDQSKTRLADVLSPAGRIELSRSLLRQTIEVARQISEIVVISRDAAVRRMARQVGAWALVEAGRGLNRALRQASAWVALQAAGEAILILPGDLPLLQVWDLTEMIELGQQTPSVVIGPCHRLDGTNALLIRPPGLIEFAFGPGSFAKHQQAARAAGVEPVIYHSKTLALDLDLPQDLKVLQKQQCEDLAAATQLCSSFSRF